MHLFPQRESLQELGNEIFKLVSYGATSEQWAEWLRVPLEHAVARGNLDLVDTLLQAGADGGAGWRGCRGRTLLHAAAVGGNPDVLTALLGAGAQPDVNVVSLSPKRSALYVATVCGHTHVARRLILAGADVRCEDLVDQCSILHEAASDGHEQLVNDLLIGGADPNADSREYGTPLHQAADAGHAGITSALLLRGANKDALTEDGDTPLMWAAERGRLDVMETLVAAGADLNIRDKNNCSAVDQTALKGSIPVLKAILGYGADVNSRDHDGHSALHKVVARRHKAGVIDALVEAGADIELKSNSGDTPLFRAAYFSNAEALLALLKRGASVLVRNGCEETPLHRACSRQFPGLEVAVDLLLRWGADETALDNHDETPADVLAHVPYYYENRSPIGEVERVRLLLARAPADRAWRRRGWLVMVRSRTLKERGCRDNARNDVGSSSNAARDLTGEVCKIARTHGAAGGAVEHDTHGRLDTGSSRVEGEVGAGAGAESGGLRGMVALLVGLEVEGIFRTAVGFL